MKNSIQTLKKPKAWLSLSILSLLVSFILASCEESDPKVIIGENPEAGFEFEVDAENPLLVNFTNLSTNGTSFSWFFGDSTYAISRDATHEYDTSIHTTVMLVVANRNFVKDTVRKEITVAKVPEPNFTTTVEGKTATFNNTSGHSVSWVWDFGDGATSTELSPTHTYSSDGLFDVKLVATNLLGETAEIIKNVGVGPIAVADFIFAIDKNKVTFENASANGASYAWDFGDGETSTDENPSNVFPLGTFDVKLTTTNDLNSNEIVQTITITEATYIEGAISSTSGRTWTLAEIEGSVKVGPEPDKGDWWSGPSLEDVQGDRACHQDDAFTFLTDGTLKYDSQGETWDEFTGSNACIDPANLPGALSGLADNDNHGFTVTEATDTDPAKITAIGTGAFIGFNKPNNSGEYNASSPVLSESIIYQVVSYTMVDGKERLVIAVDYCGPFCWWTIALEPND
ncbi:MAG: PKD domain-containing protein [Cyclobacteriaceae bacterium]